MKRGLNMDPKINDLIVLIFIGLQDGPLFFDPHIEAVFAMHVIELEMVREVI